MLVTVLALTLNGITLGLVIATVAIGFSLIFGISGVINFAHGITYAIGAFLFWVLKDAIGFWPSLAIIPIIVAVIGLIIEVTVVRRVVGLDPLFSLLITLGLYIALDEVIRMIFGAAAHTVSAPAFLRGAIEWGDFIYSEYRLFVAAFSGIVLGAVWLLINRTKIGAIVKAGMYDDEMVGALGHRLPAMRTLVFAVGSALAGLSGIIAAPIWSIKSGMGLDIIFPCFAVVLLGGLGSITGTIIGGLIVGLCLSLGCLINPRFVDITPFLAMGIVIYFWPRGLFGQWHIVEE